jgi:hypothetical protein
MHKTNWPPRTILLNRQHKYVCVLATAAVLLFHPASHLPAFTVTNKCKKTATSASFGKRRYRHKKCQDQLTPLGKGPAHPPLQPHCVVPVVLIFDLISPSFTYKVSPFAPIFCWTTIFTTPSHLLVPGLPAGVLLYPVQFDFRIVPWLPAAHAQLTLPCL